MNNKKPVSITDMDFGVECPSCVGGYLKFNIGKMFDKQPVNSVCDKCGSSYDLSAYVSVSGMTLTETLE